MSLTWPWNLLAFVQAVVRKAAVKTEENSLLFLKFTHNLSTASLDNTTFSNRKSQIPSPEQCVFDHRRPTLLISTRSHPDIASSPEPLSAPFSGVYTALAAIRSTLESARYTIQKGGLERTEGVSFIVALCFAEICQYGRIELKIAWVGWHFSGRWLLKDKGVPLYHIVWSG